MFVRNRSGLEVVLARGHLTDDTAVASLNIEMVYAIAEDGRLSPKESPDRSPTDPPDVRRTVLWRGASVTASGHVEGPRNAPHVQLVQLRVGERIHRLLVHGPRRWRRSWGTDLAPTEPEPFDAVPLTWEHAFGGEYTLAPGPAPETGLPHPGGRVHFVFNPRGVGFYPSAEAAAEQPLPAIERPEARIRNWKDQPIPGGFAPCADLPALRFDPALASAMRSGSLERSFESLLSAALRGSHHAPGELISESLPAGTPIATAKLGRGTPTLGFFVPVSPVDVRVRSARTRTELAAAVRSVHIDTDARGVRITFAHRMRYAPSNPPEWFEVTLRGAA